MKTKYTLHTQTHTHTLIYYVNLLVWIEIYLLINFIYINRNVFTYISIFFLCNILILIYIFSIFHRLSLTTLSVEKTHKLFITKILVETSTKKRGFMLQDNLSVGYMELSSLACQNRYYYIFTFLHLWIYSWCFISPITFLRYFLI